MRIAIVGSRSITDVKRVKSIIDLAVPLLTYEKAPVTVLSGGAKGVDTIAQEWASDRSLDFILFKPYHLVDKRVSYEAKYFFVRNKQMVDNCDAVLVIWDETSKGCFDAAKYANKCNKPVALYSTEQDKLLDVRQYI